MQGRSLQNENSYPDGWEDNLFEAHKLDLCESVGDAGDFGRGSSVWDFIKWSCGDGKQTYFEA